MSRYFIQLSYDGTSYHGWQIQKNANSVQAELNKALETVLQTKIETIGCGRTDTGVHASDFYAHVDISNKFNTTELIFKLNTLIPPDISVRKMFQVSDTAHVRFDAIQREYKYFIAREKDPFLIKRAHYWRKQFDLDLMNNTAELLKVYSDFTSFSKTRTQVKSFICTISHAEWTLEKIGINKTPCFVFTIRADRFLRGMVRAIVGTLLEVGEGVKSIDDFKKIIDAKDRKNAGAAAPPQGLFLTRITYPDTVLKVQK